VHFDSGDTADADIQRRGHQHEADTGDGDGRSSHIVMLSPSDSPDCQDEGGGLAYKKHCN
jgi:hypothetical protein